VNAPNSSPLIGTSTGTSIGTSASTSASTSTSGERAAVVEPAVAPVIAPVVAAAPAPAVRWWAAAGAVLVAATTAALVLAWNTQQRVKALEGELVKRQQDSGSQATEARTLAREADSTARDTAAKVALVEARVAESSMQRSQLEELIQSLARSRDENVLADVDAALRVALQQTAITGSAEPLVLTLKQADERLARYNQPRLERVRRALAQDLERTRAAGVADLGLLTLRLDEVIRQIDSLPLVSEPERTAKGAAVAEPAAIPASGPNPSPWLTRWSFFSGHVWQEAKSLIRVTRIDHPDAMLLAPEHAFFLRENLKLRLLNARLALLSRQFESAQSDLRDSQAALNRHFDRSSKRVGTAAELLRQVATQARQVAVPRPDASLAAIATASAGR
jgi:uroporphyrin-III C-methyltransferase